MKRLFLITVLVWSVCQPALQNAKAAEAPTLEVLKLRDVPAGYYDVQIQHEGKKETVLVSIQNNRATFVKSSSAQLEGLSGGFELIGNGVFLARLACKVGGKSQWWIFQPDGSATVKEIPDRGEQQRAKPMSTE
jgi:hypothetical protein